MTSIITIDGGIEYLKARGFQAMRREWAMGSSLFAFVGESKVDGVALSDFGLYIYTKDGQWFVVVGQGKETDFPAIEPAVLFAENLLRLAGTSKPPS